MSMGGVNYNETSTFANKKNADEYVDSAIARNIQHSLKCYQYENHFRNLRQLYEQNELTNAINRVVENINRALALSVLTDEFKSHDLGRSVSNLRGQGYSVLNEIDRQKVTEDLMSQLEIRNTPELSVALEEVHLKEIIQYLIRLDMIHEIDEEKCKATEFRFGTITGKYVIYRGEDCEENGIQYLNVEEYLKSLP